MFSKISNDMDLANAINLMREAGTDLAAYEIKEAGGGFPSSVVESMVAFANTSGGVIVLGISEKTFQAVDIDVKLLQSRLAQTAREHIVPAVHVDILVLRYAGKPVVVANVPELPAAQKPCYVKKHGRVQGSYLRTGDGDYHLTMYEIDRFVENQHRVARNDVDVVFDATVDDLDRGLLDGWLKIQRGGSFGGTASMSDEQLMVNRRIVAYDSQGALRPTIAGLLAIGSFPQKFFPRLNIVFSAFPTPAKGDATAGGRRFVDSENIDGSIPVMLLTALRAVSRNIRHGAVVQGALREDVPEYPLAAVREAVANALMHRDYSLDAQGSPVRVELYPDRLEIINPGGLFGPLTVEELGEKGETQSRNQFLSRILEDVPYTDVDGKVGHVVENRGTGYAIIKGSLAEALMDPPISVSTLSEFRILFRHRKMTEQEGVSYSRSNVEQAILMYLAERQSASSSELANAAGLSTKTIRDYISRMMAEGVVEGIGSKYSPKRRYRLVR
ncbi:ATP-dependent DNA helicase recG C-terminal [Bifidobacterium lemurum]|uniref:ATP-dependent DNA helicase recG C-terminal n=1 Tax=Bifidobacterium lemurum TaxID=1603886 RepID=A0A261FUI4_9BIFI|nr:ATP-binding protein [Bifidobacterium lemurum]OZG62847.1 ATP-dependent DNA helicase recG C-terminal [Bifidobacterium lemurum]QOL35176.1 putative DNA binding domain-containing protein [Bifidobacterium lemurum]